ncbi:unnamed protein product [Candidula unifasciata]|uniref:Acyl-CoA thioesterase 8 n=1 Tax=Candidula unifasciata TaxID=100452 RepID=A0A8S3ZRN1_9EUPU|nr:unnamed protein product [Candidula unifasciata]
MSTRNGRNNFSAHIDSSVLRSVVNLEKINDTLFRSQPLWKHKAARGIYGGHVIGQALAAASQGVPDSQHTHSLHSYFLNKVQDNISLLYHVEKIRDGKTYCARSVKAVQSGAVVFTMQVSFKQEETTSTVHQLPMPEVPHPDGLQTMTEMLDRLHVQKRISEIDYSYGTAWYDAFPAITKLVEPEQLLLKESSYPRRHLWLKIKEHIGEELHQNIHKCCLVYLSDSFLLQTALLCLAPISSTSSIFHTSLDHSVWFHAPCRADQWLLYQVETQYLGNGRAFCQGRMWDNDGNLLVTVAQEGVMRYDKILSRL